jgi:hypothetical protein
MRLLAITAYLLGATALGALSVGHEYTHRTLGALLAQPIDRRRLLLAKRLVLAGWLLALGALACGLLLWSGAEAWRMASGETSGWWGYSLLALPMLWALGIAPWLTLCFRNAIAGVVFTLAVPAACWAAASTVIFAREGMTRTALEAGETLTLTILWAGVATVGIVGVVASGRLFARAEASDESGGEWALGSAGVREGEPVSGAARRVHRPIRLLIGKELRLQIWLAAVAGLYVLAWAAVSLWRPEPDLVATTLSMFTGLYGLVIALFAGALASAEERGLGTLEWQALLPYPVWLAWAVKVATMSGLVLVLALGLPALLSFAGPVAGEWRPPVLRMWSGFSGGHWFFLCGAALVAVSLYVSSLCTSALRALLVSFPVVVVGGSLVVAIVTTVNGYLWRGLGVQATLNDIWQSGSVPRDETRIFVDMFFRVADLAAVALALAFIGALLWLACRNHHTARSQASVPLGQVAGVVTSLVAASVAAGAVQPVLLALGLRAG